VEGQLLQQSSGSRASGVRGSIDRGLEYVVSDLRGDRGQRVDGSERDPEKSEYVHVVLVQYSDVDPRPACELHTHKLRQSHADPNAYADKDYTDAQATSDTATSALRVNWIR
jgi:hypothetical protein